MSKYKIDIICICKADIIGLSKRWKAFRHFIIIMTEEVDTMTSSNLQNKYPPVLCVRQVAEILVVSHNTAYELVRSGTIHSVRVGRNYRIPLEAVIDYLSKH